MTLRSSVPWLMLDLVQRSASQNGRPVNLRRKEFDLLVFLVRNADRFVSRREILAEVWDDPRGVSTNSLNVHLSRLRAKLGESPESPRFLHTCRQRGVMFAAHRAHTFSPIHELHVLRTNTFASVAA